MTIVATNGVHLHVETFGEAGEEARRDSSQPILLLHGALSDTQQNWRMVLEPLAKRHRLIGVDLRGHGQSDNPSGSFTLAELREDVRGVLDTLALDRVHLLGCSLGGYVALALRHAYPQRCGTLALAGVKVGLDRAHAVERFEFFQPAVIAKTYPHWLPHLAKAHSGHYGPDHWKTLVRWVGALLADLPGEEAMAMATLAAEANERPLFYAVGDRDELVPLEEVVAIRAARPDAQILVVPRAGHLFREYNPTVFSAAYLDFLKRHPF